MRISGGLARGIPLLVPKGDAVRPATDGMRQAVFSSLGARVMAVVPGRAPALEVTRATLELLTRGTAGEVAHLDDGRPAGSRARTTWWS